MMALDRKPTTEVNCDKRIISSLMALALLRCPLLAAGDKKEPIAGKLRDDSSRSYGYSRYTPEDLIEKRNAFIVFPFRVKAAFVIGGSTAGCNDLP